MKTNVMILSDARLSTSQMFDQALGRQQKPESHEAQNLFRKIFQLMNQPNGNDDFIIAGSRHHEQKKEGIRMKLQRQRLIFAASMYECVRERARVCLNSYDAHICSCIRNL